MLNLFYWVCDGEKFYLGFSCKIETGAESKSGREKWVRGRPKEKVCTPDLPTFIRLWCNATS